MDVSEIHWGGEFYVLEGTNAVYDVSSVESIDEILRHMGPCHSDVDLLLDARRLVALADDLSRERA